MSLMASDGAPSMSWIPHGVSPPPPMKVSRERVTISRRAPVGSASPPPVRKLSDSGQIPKRVTCPLRRVASAGSMSVPPASHHQQASRQEAVRQDAHDGSALQYHKEMRQRVADLEERASQHEMATTKVANQLNTALAQFREFADHIEPLVVMMSEKLQVAIPNMDMIVGRAETVPHACMHETTNIGDVRTLENGLLAVQDKLGLLQREVQSIQEQELRPCEDKDGVFAQEVAHHAELILTQRYSHQKLIKEVAELQEQVSSLRNQGCGPSSGKNMASIQKVARDCDVILLQRGFQNAIDGLHEEISSIKRTISRHSVNNGKALVQEVMRHGDFESEQGASQKAVSNFPEEIRPLHHRSSGLGVTHNNIQAAVEDVTPNNYCNLSQQFKKENPEDTIDCENARPSELEGILNKLGDLMSKSECRDSDEETKKLTYSSPHMDVRIVMRKDARVH